METANSRAHTAPTKNIETTLRRMFGAPVESPTDDTGVTRSLDASLWMATRETQNILAILQSSIVEIDRKYLASTSEREQLTLIAKRDAHLELIQIIAAQAGAAVEVSFRIANS